MTNHTLFRCNPAVSLACSPKLVSDALAEKDIVECDHFDLSPCDRLDLRFCDLCRYSNSDVSPAFSFAGSGCCSSGILARARRELVGSTSPAEVACGHYRLRDVCAWRWSLLLQRVQNTRRRCDSAEQNDRYRFCSLPGQSLCPADPAISTGAVALLISAVMGFCPIEPDRRLRSV